MPDIFVAGSKTNIDKDAPLQSKGTSLKEGLGSEYIRVVDRLKAEQRSGRVKVFQVLPKRIKFETQEDKEEVVLLLRRHWVTQVKWIVSAGLGMLVPLIFIWVPLLQFLPLNFRFMMIVIWYLLVIAYIFEGFITWFYHVFIVTDERVIDINFYNLVYKEVSSAKIDNIEDVTYRQGGVLKAMLNYGDVVMQTAAEKQEFMIECAPQPNRIVKILNELKLEEEHEKIMGRVR